MAGPGSRLTWLPLSAAIDLHEIHLAPQPSLQVPVGHIPVPGGIKLCSPGTFLAANYLIINNGSFQVNFTKPNSSTIRYTHSKWLREDATEASVGRVVVPKTGQKPPSPRRDGTDASVGKVAVKNQVVNPTLIPSTVPISFPSARDRAPEVPVGRVVVPKKGQKPLSPRRDATGVLVGRAAVSKTGQKPPSPRRDATEVPVGRVAVPKTVQKPPFATQGWLWSTYEQGRRAKDRPEAPFATPGCH